MATISWSAVTTRTPRPPLDGVRVVDFSRVLAGPFCTMQLADLGAEVVKIEEPGHGDETRAIAPPEAGGESHYYLAYNRTKKGIAVDVRTPEGRDIAKAIALRSDVLVENFRTGVMKRFGLDYETLAPEHPALVYCSISAYGRTGPFAERAGFDPILQAESGMMSMTGEPGGDPLRHPLAIIDTVTALYATSAILAALLARRDTGRGQLVELSLLDCGVAATGNAASYYLTSGTNPVQMGNTHPTAVPVSLFKSQTGPFYIACASDRLFRRLCRDVLERPDVGDDPRFSSNAARVANRDALFSLLRETFLCETREHWLARFHAAGLPAGAVRTMSEALESEEVRARDLVQEIPHPTAGSLRALRSPLRLAETPLVPPAAPPLLGQHTDEVLRELLGLDDRAIHDLRARKVIR
jgi:crotonobetainyl-CoA:carnitine CoA-transferase CaiB-like acyl-CoA transferase